MEGVWHRKKYFKRYFALEVESRDTETIKSIILRFVEPESLIFTDQ